MSEEDDRYWVTLHPKQYEDLMTSWREWDAASWLGKWWIRLKIELEAWLYGDDSD